MADTLLECESETTPSIMLSTSIETTRKPGWNENFFWETTQDKWQSNPVTDDEIQASLLLYKLYNSANRNDDWIDMNFHQSFNNRCTKFRIFDESSLRIGKNILTNRLTLINNQIEYDWLNKTEVSYKVACKKLFLTWV